MNDFTIILLCIACPLVICALVGVEIFFITRHTRKTAMLNHIRINTERIQYVSNRDFDIIVPAVLYGKPIEVAIKNNFIHLINDGKFFAINIDDFISITYKNGKYVFKLANLAIANTKVFEIKCDDNRLLKYLNIATPDSQEGTAKPQAKKGFLSTSTGRFVLIGIVYAIFFIIFALTGNALYYVLTTVLFAVGLTIFIVHHYVTNSKSLTEGTKSEILEKREKQKLFYSKVIAVCLGIVIVITLLCKIPSGGNSSGTGTCDVCGGSGTVTSKILGQGSGIQNGFDTYYRCGACHGTGRK